MELRDLRYAIAIADEGGFTRAAARLNLVQQALSKQIGALERELGVLLFVRVPRGTRLTPAGAAFVEGARVALADSERAVARARCTGRQEAKSLRLGLMPCPTLAAAATPPLQCFRRENPYVSVEVVQVTTNNLFAAIHDGTIDVAIAYVPPDESAQIIGECVWEQPLGAVLPACHPLAIREDLTLSDLADLPLIIFERDADPVGYDAIIRALSDRGLKPRIANVRAAGPPELIGTLVTDGVGWTLATLDRLWPLYARIRGLVFRSLAGSPLVWRQWNLWLAGQGSPLIDQFERAWSMVRDTIGQAQSGP